MNREIERKFLLTDDWKEKILLDLDGYIKIRQGYLKQKDPVIRVRVSEDSQASGATFGYITIKGNPTEGEIGVDELENTILSDDAESLLADYCTGVIDKIRYRVMYDGKVWEIDEFYGANAGLAFCEIELEYEDENINIPDFVAMEVTGQEQYYNNYLIDNPYTSWKE